MKLQINGRAVECEVPPETPLLWVLRDSLKLTGTKYGCGIGVCGTCTVKLGDEAVRSCITPVSEVTGRPVLTIEGLAGDGLHPLQAAWIAEQVPQCGYCQSGMLMAAATLLAKTPKPTDADIDAQITNICRCGTYPRVRRAIHRVAGAL